MTDDDREILDCTGTMTDQVRNVLESLNQDERQQILHALLIEHFAAGERDLLGR